LKTFWFQGELNKAQSDFFHEIRIFSLVAVACHIAGVLSAKELKIKVKLMQKLTKVLSSCEETEEELNFLILPPS